MPNVPEAPGLQAQGQSQGLSRRPSAPASSGSTWARASASRRRGSRPLLDLPPDEVDVDHPSRGATSCRRSRATSTPRISASCMAVTSTPHDLPETDPFYFTITNRAPQYHVADTPWGTHLCGLPRRRAGQDLLGASPTSCSRSGRRRPTASSGQPTMPAPGCRSTTATPCSSSSGGTRPSRRGPAAAAPQGRHADRRHRPRRHQYAAQHDGLARPLAAGARTSGNDWGIDRDAQRSNEHLQRHRQHPPAGPGDHREHGADHRPRPCEHPGAVGPDDHPHAPSPAAWRRGRCATRGRCRRASSDPERLSAARAAATSSVQTTRARGRRSAPRRFANAMHPTAQAAE